MKYISIIGTVGVPACYGGFESLVDNLLDYTPRNVQYTVFCSTKKYKTRLETYKGSKLVYLNMDANGKGSILYDFNSMRFSLDADIMLVLGVSGCIFLPYIRRKFRGKIITNIDGLEWQRSKWKGYVKHFLHYSEKKAVKYSDVVIGDNRGIVDYLKEAYGIDAVLIAYGGDQSVKVSDDSLYFEYPFCYNKYAITVCRIEPENNIQSILEACSKLNTMPMVIVGNWQQSEYGRALKIEYSVYKNLHLLEPIYEPHKLNWLRSNAFIYIHGHSAGGTNPSLVEAMNLGLPVLAYDCVYNRATTEGKCLYWKNSVELENIIRSKLESFTEIAAAMQEVGKRLYCWRHIAEQYNALYARV
jgi:glycosyltransferase involved in cell wall biosynthesis